MAILVDTSVWIGFFNGVASDRVRILEELIEADEDIVLSDLILTEILQGFKFDEEFAAARDHLLSFQICTLSGVESYIKAAQIYRECRKKGITIRSTTDCLIAQTAIEYGLILLHEDHDFELIASACPLALFTP